MRARDDTSGDWMASVLPASVSGLIPADELAKAKASMPERLYNQEFECAFLEDASSVFHRVDDCIGGKLEEPIYGQKYILGVDLGRTNDYTVLLTIRASDSHVCDMQRFGQTSWAIQKEKIVLTAKKYNNAMIVIDATGFSAGSVIAEDLLQHPLVKDLQMCDLQVIPFNFGGGQGKNKKALVEKLTVAIEQRLITYPNIPELVDELKAYTYEVTPSGSIRYTAPEGLHDDCVCALGLAVFGLGSYVYASLGKPRRQSKPEPVYVDNI
jgi:hypothetical protein